MLRLLISILVAGLQIGCSNVIRSGLLNSNSIFLPPSGDRSIYIDTRNVSENQQVTLGDLGYRLSRKGYQVTPVSEQAHYWIQTRIVYCHTARPGLTPDAVVQSGFGSGIGSGGIALTSANPFMEEGAGAVNRVGAGGMPDLNAMMAMAMRGQAMSMGPRPEEGSLYVCAADVQITERLKSVTPQSQDQGAGAPANVHHMRMVASVRQKKFDLPEATPIIQDKLATGLAGLF